MSAGESELLVALFELAALVAPGPPRVTAAALAELRSGGTVVLPPLGDAPPSPLALLLVVVPGSLEAAVDTLVAIVVAEVARRDSGLLLWLLAAAAAAAAPPPAEAAGDAPSGRRLQGLVQ